MRDLASNLINQVAEKGRCDFNEAFAKPFPTLIFLKLMGWPLEEQPLFQHWTQTLIKSFDPQVLPTMLVRLPAGFARVSLNAAPTLATTLPVIF